MNQPMNQNECSRQNIVVNQNPKTSVDWNTSPRHTTSGFQGTKLLPVPTVPLRYSIRRTPDAPAQLVQPVLVLTKDCIVRQVSSQVHILFLSKQALPVPASSKDMRDRRLQITKISKRSSWPVQKIGLRDRKEQSGPQLIFTQCTYVVHNSAWAVSAD